MLINLHVKNLALIEEAEIDFREGLNILTGETGAGKSIIIGSINLALGGKVSKDSIRKNAESALVELVFEAQKENQLQKLRNLDIAVEEDGQVIISRKITNGRSISKVNGETVSAAVLQKIREIFIDIHGQHEHQSLQHKKKHLEILDDFAAGELEEPKHKMRALYKEYMEAKNALQQFQTDGSERERKLSLLQYEINEIENANLQPDEDIELENRYKKMVHGKKIAETCMLVHNLTGYETEGCAGENIGKAVRELSGVVQYDSKLDRFFCMLGEIEGLLNDFNREIADYAQEFDFSQEDFSKTEQRLDVLNYLKSKYGQSVDDIYTYLQIQKETQKQMLRYEETLEQLRENVKNLEYALEKCSAEITAIRKKHAKKLVILIKKALLELNFPDVQFEMEFKRIPQYQENGRDEAEFLISTNPGEKVKALGSVASGGELSRIMLAVKTVLAQNDDVDTLIFDEIDVGISGRTAQKVSEMMSVLAKTRQIICITHLAQIAAMADVHFSIAKTVRNNETTTSITELSEAEMVNELARIIGGAQITKTVISSAKEMKELAKRTK